MFFLHFSILGFFYDIKSLDGEFLFPLKLVEQVLSQIKLGCSITYHH
jgi:hypothetical protein